MKISIVAVIVAFAALCAASNQCDVETWPLFTIPITVMQKQMQEVWDIPMRNLKPPHWPDDDPP
jgi:hypothetical protein